LSATASAVRTISGRSGVVASSLNKMTAAAIASRSTQNPGSSFSTEFSSEFV
jgi:hypothetical protein